MIPEREDHSAMLPRPLDGRLVLDFGNAIAGPVCATILGEFGADVVKIERPDGGDPLRTYGPSVDEVPLWWMIEGRNKRSMTLNLQEPAGQKIALELISHADVLVENFRPGTMDRWGLGYGQIHTQFPKLVYVAVSGFGQTGPYRERGAYDRVAQAMAGLTYVTGFPDGPPVRPGLGVTDYGAAVTAALGAMMALYARDAAGVAQGQQVDVGLYEPIVRMFHYFLPEFERTGRVPERAGNVGEAMVPAGCYQSADGRWVTLAVGSNRLFETLMRVIGRAELAVDERFDSNASRSRHHEVLDQLLGSWISERPARDVLAVLEDAGIPSGPVHTAADVYNDPHFRSRGTVTTVEDPRLGDVCMQGVVPRLEATPGRIDRTGPELGEHTVDVLTELLGMTPSSIASLRAEGVI